MSFFASSRLVLFIVLSLNFSLCLSASAQKPRVDLRAYELAQLLKKSQVARGSKPTDLGKTSDLLKRILSKLEDSFRTSGPAPRDLMFKAYDEFLEKEVGHHEATATSGAILKAWETASGKGMFNEARQFTGRITRGRDLDKQGVFEYIVPPEEMPRMSTHLANIRLTIPSMAREKGAPMTARDQSKVQTFAEILNEMDQRQNLAEIGRKEKFNGVGQTASEAQIRWEKEVKEAGDAIKQLPNIQLRGNQSGSPTRGTKDRWRVSVDVGNISRFPAEVEVQWWLFGITEEKRDHYIMTKGVEKLQLRRNMDVQFDLFTSPRKTYKNQADDNDGLTKKERKYSKVVFRGFAIKVVHAEGVAATAASDLRLLSYINEKAEEGEKDDGREVGRVKDFSKPPSKDSGYYEVE